MWENLTEVYLSCLKTLKQEMSSRHNKILNGLTTLLWVTPEDKINPEWLHSRPICWNTLSLTNPIYWSMEQVTLGKTG